MSHIETYEKVYEKLKKKKSGFGIRNIENLLKNSVKEHISLIHEQLSEKIHVLARHLHHIVMNDKGMEDIDLAITIYINMIMRKHDVLSEKNENQEHVIKTCKKIIYGWME